MSESNKGFILFFYYLIISTYISIVYLYKYTIIDYI